MTTPKKGPRTPVVPEKPSIDGLEARWAAAWEESALYQFKEGAPREEVFSIDTPPPTVSGSLHVGHVFSYTHTDTIARYQRMRQKKIFYPMGWDDNGLPTERRVQNYFGVRCDPALPYDPDFVAPEKPFDPPLAISRPNFIALCNALTEEDEEAFEKLWRTLGLSVDWSRTYATISPLARRVSQRAFLRLLERDQAYQHEAPTLWDVDFQTAVSQAELEDREREGAYHRIRMYVSGDESRYVEIETTRPELLPACVALVANPDDARYKPFFGTQVETPLFGVSVPVVAHHLADPEKGSGIAMVCTFGDQTDVVWWKEFGLPTRTLIGRDGRMEPAPFGEAGWECANPEAAQHAYSQLVGRSTKAARSALVEMLKESGALIGEPRPIMHAVKFFEKGDRPLEIVASRQWFVRTLPLRERLLELGSQLQWYPPYMETRYRAWVEGLASDWNVSRQRFFGVPIPVYYEIDHEGTVRYDRRIVPNEDQLPIDPSTDTPKGYTETQRGLPGGFIGDPDVFDTWATSSLTPLIAGGWEEDPALFASVFPMDVRPQGHDIIRTWLFSTVVRSELEFKTLPWKRATISGWVLDPDRKKMSKSKGNVVTPLPLLETHGADAVRYWAASGRPGTDTAVDDGQMKIGRRLAIKILNASKFTLGNLGEEIPPATAITERVDLDLLASLAQVVTKATDAFEGFDYAKALEVTEEFFWRFCDDYVELVKGRAYGDDASADSAKAALSLALSVQLRLFAPFLPFVTEEVWHWFNDGSIHIAPWPTLESDFGPLLNSFTPGESAVFDLISAILADIRRQKTQEKRSMRAGVKEIVVTDAQEKVDLLPLGLFDLSQAGGFSPDALRTQIGEPSVSVTLADEPPNA